MDEITCECGRTIAPDDENSVKHRACFKCRIQGVGMTFVGGGGYGRAQFSSMTNGEFLREHVLSAEGETHRHR